MILNNITKNVHNPEMHANTVHNPEICAKKCAHHLFWNSAIKPRPIETERWERNQKRYISSDLPSTNRISVTEGHSIVIVHLVVQANTIAEQSGVISRLSRVIQFARWHKLNVIMYCVVLIVCFNKIMNPPLN